MTSARSTPSAAPAGSRIAAPDSPSARSSSPDTPSPATGGAPVAAGSGTLRQWRVLLGTAGGIVGTEITACTAAEALDHLERTVCDETLLGIIDVTPHDDAAPPPAGTLVDPSA